MKAITLQTDITLTQDGSLITCYCRHPHLDIPQLLHLLGEVHPLLQLAGSRWRRRVAALPPPPHRHQHAVGVLHLLRQHLPELGHLDAVVECGTSDAEARPCEEVTFCK